MTVDDQPPAVTPERYNPSQIEPKWQSRWELENTFVAKRHPGRPKYYVLDMFPYPSGAGLHVGHPEGYTATDIIARYKRMRGFDVLHPMGWDAFGLPAEQHAIQTGTHPRETTKKNIATFKRQLKSLGFSYDWSREIDTTDPNYVRWTQWIFLQLFKKGLAEQREVAVNWCPALGTVLSNEEVVGGLSERGQHPVERVPLRQWILKITDYADRLDEDLAMLDWPDTKAKQHHWIGRSDGAIVNFGIEGGEAIPVFTTRHDTLGGVTYIVVAPEHARARSLTTREHLADVERYISAARAKSDIERSDLTKTKSGVFTGSFATNPLNGERVPIWIADYVIGSYGTGAVMAVPGHDERDHVFAHLYRLPIRQVVAAADGRAIDVQAEAFLDDGVTINAGATAGVVDGMTSEAARAHVVAWLERHGYGSMQVTYRLRDWVFSRQRYWGEPIPIYFPVECAGDPRAPGAKFTIRHDLPIAVEESELPLRLPELDDFRPGSDPAGPLARSADWRFFQKDGSWFARETNTMPNWAGSCWYYLRFLDPTNDKAMFDLREYDAWMPIDLYLGGSEHAVLHLLYARFWHKVLFDMGLVKDKEPFTKLVHQGMILGENNEKMSKSRGNVVNPDDVVRGYGADALRVYEMFMGPLEQSKPWQTSGIEGTKRFLDRVWNVCTVSVGDVAVDDATLRLVHKTIKKVTEDIESMRFNTAISSMMILVKSLGAIEVVPREIARLLALIVSPFAPHLGEELWQRLGGQTSLAYEPWPSFDADLVRDDVIEIGVQVNGKARGTAQIAVDADEEAARDAALLDPRVKAHIDGKTIRKVIFVKGKIINFIVG